MDYKSLKLENLRKKVVQVVAVSIDDPHIGEFGVYTGYHLSGYEGSIKDAVRNISKVIEILKNLKDLIQEGTDDEEIKELLVGYAQNEFKSVVFDDVVDLKEVFEGLRNIIGTNWWATHGVLVAIGEDPTKYEKDFEEE